MELHRMMYEAGGRALTPKNAFGWPTLCGFQRVGLSLVPFPISIFHFLTASIAADSGGGWTSWQAGKPEVIGI
jgi:hypothetical protein